MVSSSPCTTHMFATERILRYVNGTLESSLHLWPHSSSTTLSTYSDVYWTSSPGTRRSTAEYLVYLGSNISWSSKKQPMVSRSSAEIKYHSLSHVCVETTGFFIIFRNWVPTSVLPTWLPIWFITPHLPHWAWLSFFLGKRLVLGCHGLASFLLLIVG